VSNTPIERNAAQIARDVNARILPCSTIKRVKLPLASMRGSLRANGFRWPAFRWQ
jgi:hypothetical protein